MNQQHVKENKRRGERGSVLAIASMSMLSLVLAAGMAIDISHLYTAKAELISERGATLLEFAIGATVFLTVVFAVVEFGRLFWVHNSLKDAARRGTRYATIRKNDAAGQQAVKNVVVYGDPNANPSTATPIVPGLTTGQVSLNYQNFNGVQLSSRATVSIIDYQFQFAVPLVGGTLTLPRYGTSLPGESAGFVPCDLPSGTPMAPCSIIPN